MSVFDKLNLKDQQEILLVNVPTSFEREVSMLHGVKVIRDQSAVKEIAFALAFVTKQKEIDSLAPNLCKKAKGDAVVWFAYPKQTSKKFKIEISRDSGWQILGQFGFEAVRMVSIDEDWTAKRFRRAEHIKVLDRPESWAMSKIGKARTRKK